MVVSWPGSMRGPQVKTPLLLLLLLSTLTGTVLCQNKDDDTDPDPGEGGKGEPEGDSDTETVDPDLPESDATTAPDPSHTQKGSEYGEEEDNGSGNDESKEISNVTATTSTPDEELSPLIILIPVVLVVLIIGMIVCAIFINRRWNKKVKNQELQKEDPYLDGSSTEKVPMPMFEEDVPSVLELEMEELDQWMKKDGESAEDSKYP